MRAGGVAALACGWMLACGRAPAGPPDAERGPAAMVPAEKDRGVALCDGYVERVCACAATRPDLKEQCELARGQPEALRMHLALLGGSEGKLNDKERRIVEAQARAVIAACVRSDSTLDPATCPRPEPGTGSAPATP